MNKTYCISFMPLEPYFFAGEKSYGFGKNNRRNYNDYYIVSEKIPSQTTLLGSLRFMILQQEKKLSAAGKRDSNLEAAQNRLVGKNSFSMNPPSGKNDFGMIKELSPVFLKDIAGNKYVPLPLNQKTSKGKNISNSLCFLGTESSSYTLMDGSDIQEVKILSEIDQKNRDYADAFVNLSNQTYLSADEIFKSIVRTGILKLSKKDGFYKKEFSIFRQKGFSFCVYATLDEKLSLQDSIVYMGQDSAAFRVQITEEANTLEDEIKNAWKCLADQSFYYALSDICIKEKELEKYCESVITTVHTFRNLERVKNSNNYYASYKQSKLFHLITRGSVFFVTDEEKFMQLLNRPEYTVIGFNKVIKIGEK